MGDKEFFENNPDLQHILDTEINLYDEGRAILEKSKKGFLTWHEMMKLPHEENNYLIDKFLWEGQVCMLLAKEKVGKSLLSKQMICALTSGDALFDEYDVSKKNVVCYLQLEGDRGETKSRFTSMSNGLNVGKENFYWRFYDRLCLDKDKDCDGLVNEISRLHRNPDVIFIDPVYMACSGSLSNDEVVRKMIGNIRRIQDVFGCAVVLVHHEHRQAKTTEGKHIDEGDNAIMGSFAFKAFVSHVIRVTLKGTPPNVTRILKCDTQRNGGVESKVELILNENPLMYKKKVGPIPKGMAETIYRYIKKQKKGASAKDFIDAHGANDSTVNRAVAVLRNNGHIRRQGRKGRGEVVYVATNKRRSE